MRFYLFKVFAEFIYTLRKINRIAVIQIEIIHYAFKNMADWQKTKPSDLFVILPDFRNSVVYRHQVRYNVPMRKHHSFRLSCCTGSVDDGRYIFAIHGVFQVFYFLLTDIIFT